MADEPLQNGEVITAEMFIFEPDVGNVGFEEPLIVWDDRVERLTDATKVYW
jgi:Xaa-Pro aminopeptidase